jgi:hypothetical protein
MNYTDCEKLRKNLVYVMLQAKDEDSLLRKSCMLLEADRCILLARNLVNERETIHVLKTSPTDYDTSAAGIMRDARRWYALDDIPVNIEGYAHEGPITIGDLTYADALVAFGEQNLQDGSPMLEMILLKSNKSNGIYSSYHCWLAAQLVRYFELFHLRKSLRNESNLKEQYADSLSEDVLFEETFDGLRGRMAERSNNVRWGAYTIWSRYQTRKLKSKQCSKELLEDVWQREGVTTNTDPIFGTMISLLAGTEDHNILKVLAKLKESLFINNRAPHSDIGVKEWFKLKLIVLEHSWDLIRNQILDKSSYVYDKNNASKSNTIYAGISPNFDYQIECVRELIELTVGVIIQMISSRIVFDNAKPTSFPCTTGNPLEMGRDFLHLYLALEIAKPNSKVTQLYLDSERRDEYRNAPTELKRSFFLNLIRFILSILKILQQKLNISTRHWPISPAESLDSLLYMVDRYAHIELGVEELLNIRYHLGRQITSEIHLYLSKPHYRDHMLHVIDVFLLGHLLLNTNIYWIKGKAPMIDHLDKTLTGQDANWGMASKDDLMRNWAVASLFHDIGYQLGHGKKSSPNLNAWEEYFVLNNPSPDSFVSFPHGNRTAEKDDHQIPQKFLTDFSKKIDKSDVFKGVFPVFNAKNKKDHGVLSAIRVTQILNDADYTVNEANTDSIGDLAQGYRHAIHAIAHHNLFSHRVSIHSHPLACLLRLCDELQEWDRRRVNIEKVVKQLYLDFQYGNFGIMPSYELIEKFYSNIEFRLSQNDGFPGSLEFTLPNERPHIMFGLVYRSPIEANFDPTMTMLNKAYNLQHLDLDLENQGHNDFTISIVLHFPVPEEYRNLSEYDIYGLFTETVRELPLLREFNSISEAEFGLVKLNHSSPSVDSTTPVDCFMIRLTRKSDARNRHGWLSKDPSYLWKSFLEFKKKMLAGKS